MNSEFLPEADEEFREAVRYYEKEAPGVGLRFVAEVRRGVTFITENPYAKVEMTHHLVGLRTLTKQAIELHP